MSGVPGRPWRSQLVIVAGLVAAFALPWLVARTFAGHRDRQWVASGLSAYEINEWRENGFADPSDAIGWRNARFRAPGALLWKEEGWDDASEAVRWHEADFGAREARRWRALRFDAVDARAWRDAGFLPADARFGRMTDRARRKRRRSDETAARLVEGGRCEH